jgi:sugar lactone lactonase YvrE
MTTRKAKPHRAPWIIVGALGCIAVCLFAVLAGGGILLLRSSVQEADNFPLTSVPIPPPPGIGGVPLPPPPVDHGVTCLIEQEGAIFANAPDLHNYLSDDGGITWRETFRSGLPNGSYCLSHGESWQFFAAVDGQVQYRVTPEVGIERSEDGGKTWKREVDLAGESWQAKPQTGTPVKVEAKPGPFDVMVHRPTGNILAAMGHLGVLVRTTDGKWQWVRVGNYYRGEIAALSTPAPRAAANATPLPTPAAAHKLLTAHPQNTTNNSFGLAFSADSQTLAMVGFDAVHLWRTADWSQIRTVGQKSGRKVVEGIALSPDGQTLAYTEGSTDNTVQVWNTKDGTLMRKLQGHTSWITSVAVSADGQMFATGGSFKDPTVRLWRVSDGAPLRALSGNPFGVTRIAFSPDGQLLAADGPNRVWRIADGTALYTYEGGRRLPTLEAGVIKNGSLAFSADSKSLLAVEGDSSMRVWNMADGSLARTIMLPLPHGFDVKSAAFSSDRKLLATGLGDGTIWLWRLQDMTLLSRFTFNENWSNVAELAFSPDGTLLAATSDSGNTVRLWGVPR